MLEAKLQEAGLLKKLLDAIKELVTDANFECNEEGINLQAMDNLARFKRYRCDRPMPLGYSDRIAEYEMKLMDIDSDQLGIPETEYDARLGESVRIEVSKEGVDSPLRARPRTDPSCCAIRRVAISGGRIVAEGQDEEEDDKSKVKKEDAEKEDEDEEMGDEEKVKEEDEDGEEEKEDDEEEDEEDSDSKKRRRRCKARTAKGKSKGDDDDGDAAGVLIEMNQHVSLTFSLKYLVNFSKSASLASKVQLMMSNDDVPLLVAYEFGQGHIRYYLAPKIGDD
ncbi:hypothetical protein DFP72DRAFT_906643 [Ephemerocybe angulata]|uniref:DNA sliding clamp PCNA n=1 Tax=Ephemerocybe angulata TaxID=980116 RepID=A0A8H6M2E3_9AGAR|nr:hypothetical protein DFP72DRAFT_906643 [Tulosesus angulatus]